MTYWRRWMSLEAALAPVVIGLFSSASILGGGVAAWLMRGHGRILAGFAAGTMLMIALLDLLPTSLRMVSGTPALPLIIIAIMSGFLAFRWFDPAPRIVRWGPAWLFVHAMIDGFVIGVGFSVSWQVGMVLLVAALAHGLAHGTNTIALSLAGGGGRSALVWLLANASAPVFGVLIARQVVMPSWLLGALLAMVAGAFLFVASHYLRKLPDRWPWAERIAMTGGAALVCAMQLLLL